jgi:hypothetical protein
VRRLGRAQSCGATAAMLHRAAWLARECKDAIVGNKDSGINVARGLQRWVAKGRAESVDDLCPPAAGALHTELAATWCSASCEGHEIRAGHRLYDVA